MLHLTFQLGKERYALASSAIERILPMVHLKRLPHAPPAVRGLLNYHGTIVPVIDLCVLLTGLEARPRLSSRIIVANYGAPNPDPRRLGLLAEEVTDTLQLNEQELLPAGLTVENAPYLGKVVPTPDGLVQIIEVEHILPDSLKKMLFQPATSGA